MRFQLKQENNNFDSTYAHIKNKLKFQIKTFEIGCKKKSRASKDKHNQ